MGVDLFVDWAGEPMDANVIGEAIARLATDASLALKMITNRGVKVYPDGFPETFLTDHWRCRIVSTTTKGTDYRPIQHRDITRLMDAAHQGGYEVIKTENLYLFDGERGFSLGQGE